jgi:hypothetical protein
MSCHVRRPVRIDNLAFAIRVEPAVPSTGFGNVADKIARWRTAELGLDEYAEWSCQTLGGSAHVVNLRRSEVPSAFCRPSPLSNVLTEP